MTDDQELAPAKRASVLNRLLPPVEPVGEDGAPKPSRMTSREQLVAAGLGVVNVAIAAGTASTVGDQQALVLLAGLLGSALTVVGARVGNRILAMVGLFACTLARPSSVGIFLAIVLPYYAAAMWIFLKYNRMVKEQGALRRQQRSDQRKAGAGPSPRTGRTPAKGDAKKSAKQAPPKSKRYTPPKARKKPPPPSSKPPRDRSIVD